ncbi:polycomb group protein embryonic flower 2 [Quercus suber]|uniref:Polycomb group protein embryonic flower 2 n=1 Tax=Quercus suber TaxID=58331 RepID=A0AAW0M9N6_QUESU
MKLIGLVGRHHVRVIVIEDFACPFCLMQCASFKVTEEYQAVNVSVNIEILRSETVAAAVDPHPQTFLFWSVFISLGLQLLVEPFLFVSERCDGESNCMYSSRPRRRRRTDPDQNEKRGNVQFLELYSPRLAGEGLHKGFLEKDDDVQSCKGEKISKSFPSDEDMQNGRVGGGNYGPDYPSAIGCIERVASSSNVPGVSIATAQSSVDPEFVKSLSVSDPAVPAKARKLNTERSDSRSRVLLQKRQFFHSHRVQPMALDEVLSDQDSEDEVDDDVADLEDRRMLDDFVDVTKDEKKLMHLWNSFVRKQRVLADGHVPWACEAFSKLHKQELVSSPALFWCWRLFMIKLWNHGLLDACTMNNCSLILEKCRDEGSDVMKS